jgi:vanillate O-demethylase monooxygenase subunit
MREGVAGIFREDELILEAQQQAINANPGHPFYNLNIDAGAMWARRLIDKMIAAETTDAPANSAKSFMMKQVA